MKLYIISPFSKKIVDIAWLELNTPVGNFVIQPGHVPMVLTLAPHKNVTYCLKSGKQETFSASQQAIAEITRSSGTILLNEEPIIE
jgi:F0F1-type ATP synthase epsilon subunit